MTTKLIKTKDKFILVSDEEIKHDDFGVYKSDVDNPFQYVIQFNTDNCLKLIAHEDIPELPSIDFSLLSEEDCKTIGYVDVEKLVIDKLKEGSQYYDDTPFVDGFKKGFKASQSLNDKMFSKEEAFKIFEAGKNYQRGEHSEYNGGQEHNYPNSSKFIQSLQKNVWDVEIEMERETLYTDDGLDYDNLKPKITNNSIKILKLL